MFEKSYLRRCNSCGNEFAKSAKECPFCGKNLNSGLFLKIIIGIGFLGLISTFAIPTPNDQLKYLQKIVVAPVDQINASELAKVFYDNKANMNSQIKSREKEIKGKIVHWELEVFVVTRSSDYYKIVTKATSDAPGALLTLYPLDDQQIMYIDNIKSGTSVKIKGKITGIQQGRIKINPAVII
jgi:hypothetical protein